eukprot:TRINITY_DN67718_c7_g3_i1.p1 TRINITY_DN67718_c7_g3~~TRINITY_DN67718_c7_g3_i1.p1  ORF type:complete len:812 (-),score=438.40 TRINITY_DN67718_c7_g3_i1:1643-3946(-)
MTNAAAPVPSARLGAALPSSRPSNAGAMSINGVFGRGSRRRGLLSASEATRQRKRMGQLAMRSLQAAAVPTVSSTAAVSVLGRSHIDEQFLLGDNTTTNNNNNINRNDRTSAGQEQGGGDGGVDPKKQDEIEAIDTSVYNENDLRIVEEKMLAEHVFFHCRRAATKRRDRAQEDIEARQLGAWHYPRLFSMLQSVDAHMHVPTDREAMRRAMLRKKRERDNAKWKKWNKLLAFLPGHGVDDEEEQALEREMAEEDELGSDNEQDQASLEEEKRRAQARLRSRRRRRQQQKQRDAAGGNADDDSDKKEQGGSLDLLDLEEEKLPEKTWKHAPWPVCVEATVHSLDKSVTKDGTLDLREQEDLDVKYSVSNAIAVFTLALEFLTMISLAFSPSVPWSLTTTQQNIAGSPLLQFSSSIDGDDMIFWSCAAFALLYPMLAVPGLQKAQRGTLGRDEFGQPARWNTWPFVYSKLLALLGSAMYFPILLNLVEVFVCVYPTDGGSPIMQHDTSVVCWQASHLLKAAVAGIGVSVYYPTASFMYPNMQFVDKSLDIKFETTFLIFVAQGKLFLSGMASFFPDDPYFILVSALAVYTLFLVSNVSGEPCLVKRVNIWRTGSFAMASWACIAGLIVTGTGDQLLSFVLLVVGWCVIVIFTAVWFMYVWHPDMLGMAPDESDGRSESVRGFGGQRRLAGASGMIPPDIAEEDGYTIYEDDHRLDDEEDESPRKRKKHKKKSKKKRKKHKKHRQDDDDDDDDEVAIDVGRDSDDSSDY